MIISDGKFEEFDFFMDEDVRNQRIGILCIESNLTPALTQALFRVREKNFSDYQNQSLKGKIIPDFAKQIREIKWSQLNHVRSFLAEAFLEQFFHYACKGPLPVVFVNAPFVNNHKESINNFFAKTQELKIPQLKNIQNSRSVFFLDSFTTPPKYRFEDKVKKSNNLLRCYRIDSRAHDLIQIADILLGITVFLSKQKSTSNRAKKRIIKTFQHYKEKYTGDNKPGFLFTI